MNASPLQRPRPWWPSGFRANPWRFFASSAPWRALLWSIFLCVLAIPLLVVVVVLCPWLPLIARGTDWLGRWGARLMRVQVPVRMVNRWFDWRQCMLLVMTLILAFAHLIVVGGLVLVAGTLVVAPVILIRSHQPLMVGTVAVHAPAQIAAWCWGMAFIASVLALYGAWVLTGTSVAAAVVTNEPGVAEVRRLETSRAVLLDAFTGERQRIERQLHDGVQQYMTAVQLHVGAAQLALGAQTMDRARVAAALDQAAVNAARATEALRSTVAGLYPQVLRDAGLAAALDELLAHSGLETTLRMIPSERSFVNPPIDATSALLLYHAVAEAMTNAVRHGGATRVRVTVTLDDDAVRLVVDDDGQGLESAGRRQGVRADAAGDSEERGVLASAGYSSGDVDKGSRHSDGGGGTGIAGLRERAAALGGTVTLMLEGAPEGGARLILEVPR